MGCKQIGLHGTTSQEAVFFTDTDIVRTSNQNESGLKTEKESGKRNVCLTAEDKLRRYEVDYK
jgi:hypothetical protein